MLDACARFQEVQAASALHVRGSKLCCPTSMRDSRKFRKCSTYEVLYSMSFDTCARFQGVQLVPYMCGVSGRIICHLCAIPGTPASALHVRCSRLCRSSSVHDSRKPSKCSICGLLYPECWYIDFDRCNLGWRGEMEPPEEEILQFLTPSAKPEVKVMAVNYFLGLTGKEDGRKFIGNNNGYIEAILSLTDDTVNEVVRAAYKSLINLAVDEVFCWKVMNSKSHPSKVKDWLESVLKPDCEHADIKCSLLSNMTRAERCADKLAQILLESNDDVSISKLVLVLCNLTYNEKADLHYLASVLANLSQVHSVRQKLMDKDQFIIQRLLAFVEFKQSETRRAGILRTLRNCCFETAYHEWLLGDQVDILPRLLLPLAGPEEFDEDDMEKLPDDLQYLPTDKTREPLPNLRKMLVETILQLCATRKGRAFVKEKNAYVIMREYHKWETVDANDNAILNLVDVLIGDEPPEGIENLKEVDVPQEYIEKFNKLDEQNENDPEDESTNNK
ncbi:hypothetical protein ScPMuIL_005860 [Solemya velum]